MVAKGERFDSDGSGMARNCEGERDIAFVSLMLMFLVVLSVVLRLILLMVLLLQSWSSSSVAWIYPAHLFLSATLVLRFWQLDGFAGLAPVLIMTVSAARVLVSPFSGLSGFCFHCA